MGLKIVFLKKMYFFIYIIFIKRLVVTFFRRYLQFFFFLHGGHLEKTKWRPRIENILHFYNLFFLVMAVGRPSILFCILLQ